MPAPLDPEIVKVRLVARLGELARDVLTDVEQDGLELVGRGPDGAKWGLVWRGGKAGYWRSFGQSGVGGHSPLSFIRDACCEGDHIRAYRWALRWLGEDAGEPERPARPPPQANPGPPPKNTRPQWLAARVFAWSEPAGRYLMARGVQPALVRDPLGALRFAPAMWNGERGKFLPAMVAAVLQPKTRKHLAIHRTYLGQDHRGIWRKADVRKPKMVLGSYAGGLIPLTRGRSAKSWRDAPAGDRLILAEGIENALIVAQLHPGWRSAAYIAANNLLELMLPDCFHEICLVRDRDGENWRIREDRELAIGAWQDEGRDVKTWDPPEGIKDAADYWQAELAEGGT